MYGKRKREERRNRKKGLNYFQKVAKGNGKLKRENQN